jgi:hypothetical protein
MRERGAVETSIEIRRLARTELSRVGEIDRTEALAAVCAATSS